MQQDWGTYKGDIDDKFYLQETHDEDDGIKYVL